MAIIIMEGAQIEVSDEVAKDDNLIRDALADFCPDAATAQIVREEGKPITVCKRSGPKGSTILKALLDAPEEVNPAVAMAWRIQNLERRQELDPAVLSQMHSEIAQAIASGLEQAQEVNSSLKALISSNPVASSTIPLGF